MKQGKTEGLGGCSWVVSSSAVIVYWLFVVIQKFE